MIDWCRPGFLGTPAAFRKRFEQPILSGDAAEAKEATYVLTEILKPVVLRRGVEKLQASLLPKYEWVVCCGLSPVQAQLYRALLRNRTSELGAGPAIDVLVAYHHALQILNHPDILHASVMKNEGGAMQISYDDYYDDDDDTTITITTCSFSGKWLCAQDKTRYPLTWAIPLSDHVPAKDIARKSGKMSVLREILTSASCAKRKRCSCFRRAFARSMSSKR